MALAHPDENDRKGKPTPDLSNLSLPKQFEYVKGMEAAKNATPEQLVDLFGELLLSYLAQKQVTEDLFKGGL